jgi:hypothetical protein
MELISARDLLSHRTGEFGRQNGLFAAKLARQTGLPCSRLGRSRNGSDRNRGAWKFLLVRERFLRSEKRPRLQSGGSDGKSGTRTRDG